MAERTTPHNRGTACGVIQVAQQQWQRYFQHADALRLATLYTATGQIMPAYSPAISGRPAIQAFWQGCMDMGIGAMRRTPQELDCLGDTVNELGDYTILDGQGRVLDVGKYVVIWKAHHGQWQIHCEIWTSNRPVG